MKHFRWPRNSWEALPRLSGSLMSSSKPRFTLAVGARASSNNLAWREEFKPSIEPLKPTSTLRRWSERLWSLPRRVQLGKSATKCFWFKRCSFENSCTFQYSLTVLQVQSPWLHPPKEAWTLKKLNQTKCTNFSFPQQKRSLLPFWTIWLKPSNCLTT